jgi:hypothetical protein
MSNLSVLLRIGFSAETLRSLSRLAAAWILRARPESGPQELEESNVQDRLKRSPSLRHQEANSVSGCFSGAALA